MTDAASLTEYWRAQVRRAMPVEGDLAFRRRCETVLEYLDASPTDTVLDCGCGYGFYLRLIPELTGASIVGVDIEAERLVQAHAHVGSDERVRLINASIFDLPFPDGMFTHILCSEVLEHLDDDAAALVELRRVLKPGGRLIVTVPSRQYPFAWDPANWLLERITGSHLGGERPWSGIWYGHQRLYDQETLNKRITGAGFRIDETRPLSHFVPPFAHLVLYGLLKPLLMRGALPASMSQAGDRFAGSRQRSPGPLVSLGMGLLNRLDRLNDDEALMRRKQSFVALSLLAHRVD